MLKPYTDSAFNLLEKWITDPELLLQFAGTDFSFPVTREQISDYKSNHPERSFYLGYTFNMTPFGFGEIIPQENGRPRLGRILVGDPALRGQGLGRYFITLLLNECKHRFPSDGVDLYVWNMNTAAIRCYSAVGFKYDIEKCTTLIHKNTSYDIHKMTFTFQ